MKYGISNFGNQYFQVTGMGYMSKLVTLEYKSPLLDVGGCSDLME